LSGAVGTLSVSGATARARVAGPITDGGGTSTITVNSGGTLQAESLGASASRIDTLNLDNSTVVVDVSAGLPAGAWGYVGTLNPTGSNTVGLNFAPGTLSASQTRRSTTARWAAAGSARSRWPSSRRASLRTSRRARLRSTS
jgi:hypothetical protein